MTQWPQIEDTAAELIAEARATTGIAIVDTDALEPLTVLLDSLRKTAQFTPDGAVVKRRYILRILRNRLRMQRDLAAHPEILDIELLPPLLIIAMPRTGSTKTQKVLAATGDFNALPYWMCLNSASESGIPNEDVRNRIADVQAYADWFNEASPDTKYGHPMAPHEPEEEAYIMNLSLRSRVLAGFANAADYVSWLGTQDMGAQYRYLYDTLKYLMWQGLADPAKPFLLKCVVNLGLEPEIRAAIPDVNIAVMHRNPVSVLPSASRLGTVFRAAFSDQAIDMSKNPSRHAFAMKRHLAHRTAHPDQAFHDICYDRVRTDISAIIDGLYTFAGVEPSADTLSNIARWEAENPQNKHGAWSYAATDFGFTDDDVRREFSTYIDWVHANNICDWR